MYTVREIYARYEVPPWLQEHQIRVAAVGKIVADAYTSPIDIDLIVSTCLLHDIGAIVKFDFGFVLQQKVPGLCPPAEIAHWVQVQEKIRAQYGKKEYEASERIISELGFERIRTLFSNLGFSQMKRILAEGNKEAMIVQYADMRVGPYGILPLTERVSEVITRYADVAGWEERVEESHTYLPQALDIEKHVFEDIAIRPNDIDDATAKSIMTTLWDYELA